MKAKRILWSIFFGICALVIILVLIRIFLMSDKKTLSELYPSENAIAAYEGGNEFVSHSVYEDIADDGYYSANGLIYCPETKELQITGRYNDSLYTYFDCADTVEFTWRLEDRANEKTYEGKVVESAEKYLYNYRKIIFEDVEINDESEMYLFLCYEDKYPVEDKTKGLLIHIPGEEFKTYKLSKEEIEKLSK